MRTFLRANPLYRPPSPCPLPLLFTLGDAATVLGVHRNTAAWYVRTGKLVPMARTAKGLDLFSEQTVRGLKTARLRHPRLGYHRDLQRRRQR